MSLRLLAIAALAVPSAAHAEVGGMIGIRGSSLAGDIHDDGSVAFAGSAVVMRELPYGFAIGTEPGLRLSGSQTFRFIDVVLPVVARFTVAVAKGHRLRAILALAPAKRLASQQRVSVEEGYEWQDLSNIRSWDIDLIGGVGYELVTPRWHYFADVRIASGLTTVDVDDMPLSIYRRELGLWIGASR
jgi:hypothetical protein